MKITVKTLLDITETNKHKHNCYEKAEINQQSNFMSFFNCLSMRFNPYYDQSPRVEQEDVKALGFGSDYSGQHRVWTFDFTLDTATSITDHATLVKDFDLIPVIPGLTESISKNNNMFRTGDKKKKNIIFILPDNK